MPFTPSHVVAVLPLWPARRYLPFTALAIGSMVPDLPMFLPVSDYGVTHRTLGALTHCLPIGLVIYAMFELIMRRPMTELLPRWVRERLTPGLGLPAFPKRAMYVFWLFGISAALVIGALSHQVWDAFTHRGRWGTDLWPALNQRYVVIGVEATGFKNFQYGSTFVGLPLLTVFAWLVLRRIKPVTNLPVQSFRTQQLSVSLFLLLAPACIGVHALATTDTTYAAVGATILRSGAGIMVGLVLYCLARQATYRLRG